MKIRDRGDGLLIGKAEIDSRQVKIYRTRAGTITIEVGDQPVYALSTRGARELSACIEWFLDFDRDISAVVSECLAKQIGLGEYEDGVHPRGIFPDNVLTVKQLREGISEYRSGRRNLSDFEGWFSLESWNVHRLGSARLEDAVFAVEAALSKIHFEKASEDEFRRDLAEVALLLNEAPDLREFPALIDRSSGSPL